MNNTYTVTKPAANTDTLETIYWKSQTLHDKLFSLEYHMRKLAEQGKHSVKAQTKYFALWDELRDIHAKMTMLEYGFTL